MRGGVGGGGGGKSVLPGPSESPVVTRMLQSIYTAIPQDGMNATALEHVSVDARIC